MPRVVCFAVAALLCFFAVPGLSRGAGERTVNTLAPAEMDRLSHLTLGYYTCVADKALAVTGGDKTSPERVFATYPPYIYIVRQQCRVSLLALEKDLYAFGLNPEYITNYVTTLRDDVQHYALQQVLRQIAGEKARAAERKEQEREERGSETPPPPKPSRLQQLLGGQGTQPQPAAKPGAK